MSAAEMVRNAMVFVGAIPAIGFPIWYHLRMRWHASEMGRHIMGYSLVVAFAYASALVGIFFQDYPFEWLVRALIALSMTGVVWWRVIVFIHLRRRYRAMTTETLLIKTEPEESEEPEKTFEAP